METLVVLARDKNQYYSGSRPEGPSGFHSSPSSSFRKINCRTFESGTGILPNPFKACTSPGAKCTGCTSPKTPSPFGNPNSQGTKDLSKAMKSASLPININVSKRERYFNGDLCFSELWAGPAYSNSPPPSSLPIPKFSLRQKRTVSLDLPGSASILKIHPIAKSAPSSPTRESYPSARDLFLTPDSATRTLRRILNLDIMDE